jgi:hypothetical protein
VRAEFFSSAVTARKRIDRAGFAALSQQRRRPFRDGRDALEALSIAPL